MTLPCSTAGCPAEDGRSARGHLAAHLSPSRLTFMPSTITRMLTPPAFRRLRKPADQLGRILSIDGDGQAGVASGAAGRRVMRRTIGSSAAFRAFAAGLVAVAVLVATASGASVSQKWQAGVASPRANGTATLYVYANGTSAVGLRLVGLAPSTSYAVSLYRGTCSSLGSRVLGLPIVVSTPSGTVTRGLTLSTARTTIVRSALRARLAIVVGSLRRCGSFSRAAVTSSPSPSPTSSPSPSPLPTTPILPIPIPPLPPYLPPPYP